MGGVGWSLVVSGCSIEPAAGAPPPVQRSGVALMGVSAPGIGAPSAGAPTHSLCDYAVYSSHQSQIRDRVTVRGGLVGTSGDSVELGADSKTYANVESMHNVTLRSRAYVNGDVLAVGDITQQDGVVVTGSVLAHTTVNPVAIPSRSFTCNTSGWTAVERGQVLTLAPGSYANVAVRAGGKLVLQAGQYTFNSLRFESGSSSSYASLDVNAATQDLDLRTCGELYFGNFMHTNLLGGTQPARLKLYSNTTQMVTIGTDQSFYGVVTAPLAEIHAYSRAVLQASLYGKDVWIEPDSRIDALACTVAFVPVQPPTCPSTTNLDWNYRIGGKTGVFDLPSDPNCESTTGNPCPHYINNLDNSRWFVSNTWVGYIGFRVNSFSTESNFDFLRWGLESIPPGSVSGTVAPGTILWSNTAWSFGGIRDALSFVADYSVTYEGAYLDQVQVCTYRTSPDTHGPNTFDLKRRYNGVLLGANDVVYLQFTADAAYHYPITLWADMGGAGTNFDLYARCGALPTPTAYDWRGNSADSQEYVDVSNCAGTAYVAVHALQGSGVFSVVRGIHAPAGHTARLRAGTDFNATAAQMATFNAALRSSVRQFYGSTEGEQVIGQIDLYNSQTCSVGAANCDGANCDICFRDEAGTAYAGCGWGVVVQQSYFADGEGISHEYGHYKFCLGDEYVNMPWSVWQCGHSNMASPWGDNNNFCVDFDHKTDKNPITPVSTLPSAMTQAFTAGVAVDSENVTFDNYDYADFDFNGLVGNIVQH